MRMEEVNQKYYPWYKWWFFMVIYHDRIRQKKHKNEQIQDDMNDMF